MKRSLVEIKQNIEKKIEAIPFGRRFLDDYRFRTILMQVQGASSNLIFAIFNGVMAIYSRSSWLGSMAAYYVLLTLMRARAVDSGRRIDKESDLDQKRKMEVRLYKHNSLLFVFLGIILCGITAISGLNGISKTYPGFMIYAVALFTFYRLILSVVNMVKASKMDSPLLMIIRRLNYLDACVAVLILQTALLSEFASRGEVLFARNMNIAVSLAIGLLSFGFAIWGVIKAEK